MVIVDFFINVSESMGANTVNTILEKTSPFLETLTGARTGIKILSNLCIERRAFSQFVMPVSKMSWKTYSGEEVARRILETYRFA